MGCVILKGIVRSVLFLLLVFSFFAFADGRECGDYCRDGVAYSGGTYNERSGSCDYSRRASCEFGCSSDAIQCAEGRPSGTGSESGDDTGQRCEDQCRGGIAYSSGSYDARAQACYYAVRRSCEYGCDSAAVACAQRREAGTTTETASIICTEYCRDGIYYYGGIYSRTDEQCEYDYRRACPNGCDRAGAICAAAVEQPVSGCAEKCENSIHYYSGKMNPVSSQCEYERRSCKYGCEGERKTCALAPDTSCADYCREGVAHYRGTYNTWTQECDYTYREVCTGACDAAGEKCAADGSSSGSAQTPTQCADRDGRDIYIAGSATGWDSSMQTIIESADFCAEGDSGAQTLSGKWVVEIQCDSDGRVHAYYYECPENYWCSEGKCVWRPIRNQAVEVSQAGAVESVRVERQGGAEQTVRVEAARGVSATERQGMIIVTSGSVETPVEPKFDELLSRYGSMDKVVLDVEGGRPVYELQRTRKAMLFGFIPIDMEVSTRVDATNLGVVREITPWWSFFAFGDNGDEVSESNQQPSPSPALGGGRVSESNPQPSPGPTKTTGQISESNPQPSPGPAKTTGQVSESNPQPSPNPISESNPQPSPSPLSDGGLMIGKISGLKAAVETDSGIVESRFDGEIIFRVFTDESGEVKKLGISRLSLIGDSVKTSMGDTGEISLQLDSNNAATCSVSGCTDSCMPPGCLGMCIPPECKELQGSVSSCAPPDCTEITESDFQMSLHYPLIDSIKGFKASADEAAEPHVFVSQRESMGAQFSGKFTPSPDPKARNKAAFSGSLKTKINKAVLGGVRGVSFDSFSSQMGWILSQCGGEIPMFAPQKLCVQPVFIRNSTNDKNPTGAVFNTLIDNAQGVWEKVCVQFDVKPAKYVNNKDYRIVTSPKVGDLNFNKGEVFKLMAEVNDSKCIEIFVVEDWEPMYDGGGATWGSGDASAKIVTCDKQLSVPGLGAVNQNHLAHELGHVMGLCHPGSDCCEDGCPQATLTDAIPGTVMDPSGFEADNPAIQSKSNGMNAQNPLLSSVVDFGNCMLEGGNCQFEPCCSKPEILDK